MIIDTESRFEYQIDSMAALARSNADGIIDHFRAAACGLEEFGLKYFVLENDLHRMTAEQLVTQFGRNPDLLADGPVAFGYYEGVYIVRSPQKHPEIPDPIGYFFFALRPGEEPPVGIGISSADIIMDVEVA